MVTNQTVSLHQLLGATSCHTCSPDICKGEFNPFVPSHRTGILFQGNCTLGSDRQSPVTCTLTNCPGANSSCTSLESSSMVSNAPANAGQSTNSHPTITRHNSANMSEQSTRYNPTCGLYPPTVQRQQPFSDSYRPCPLIMKG